MADFRIPTYTFETGLDGESDHSPRPGFMCTKDGDNALTPDQASAHPSTHTLATIPQAPTRPFTPARPFEPANAQPPITPTQFTPAQLKQYDFQHCVNVSVGITYEVLYCLVLCYNIVLYCGVF